MAMQPWAPTITAHQHRRVGKTLEELGELTAVLARISIQDIDAIDPGSGKTNRLRLLEETADVIAQLLLNADAFAMDSEAMDARIEHKGGLMHEWEAHFIHKE